MALIFLDLDGTILHEGQPVKGVLESIKRLKENNHIVAIATGRSPRLIYDKDKELGIDHLVLSNGSYVMVKGKVIYEHFIPNEVVKKTMEYVDKVKADLVIEYFDTYVAYRKDTDISDRFSDIFKIERPDLNANYYPEKNVFSMVVFENHDINAMRAALPELEFNISNALGYDVNNKGGLKAEGVKALIEYLNYPIEDTYAIGDGHNDLAMLKLVKHGIAMGNSSKELKEAAEFVTTDVNDYGVMNALKHYGLI